ncbi:fumarylacetoacetate hydrolase family protein [Streptomyces hoynatensis]|uniref:FAA hydrolase family protein n=1 Tax=Streptomyces hoynatensis TaxID=1141874 RepID=A0A3A9Z9G2_9ACTN|nr:fumarylacetoacetate hydrolase family protein [Streptomyces hoynatensis]RKN43937.1 FAA hydrolase family protein [Streptomyces hoynatensis]
MKFLRIGPAGAERPVLADGAGGYVDLGPVTADIDGAFLASEGPARAAAALAGGRLPRIDVAGLRVGAPIARPGKIVCIGLNYSDHAEETGSPHPEEPVVFMKAPGTVVGPDDTVLIPRGSEKTDYEAELGVVIGAPARYLDSPREAAAVIAGYALSNDVSERAWQHERGGTWDKGKSGETFNPLGPWLVTPDELGDPQAIGLRTRVNGEPRQDGNTARMLFGVHHLVWYLSQFMVLEPGDLVNTGTPAGVAFGANDFPYLAEGDVVEIEGDRLGRQRQVIGRA